MDLNAFKRFAIERCGLKLENPIVVGVSGGADSMCLAECFNKTGFRIIIAHFDHKLRQNSKLDAELVASFSNTRDLPFSSGSEDIREYCQRNKVSIEEGARQARYQFLFEQARIAGAQAVATGHTTNDQSETVLMHFLRGSGVSGLKGMKPRTILDQFDETIPLVRPLLTVDRMNTVSFCIENGIRFVNDETNSDPAYFRNRIRLELLPLLETYQPGFQKRLQNTSLMMAEVDALLSGLVDAALKRVTVSASPIYYEFSTKALLDEDLVIQRELFRRVIHRLRKDTRDIEYGTIQRIIALIQSDGSGKRVEIMDGLEAELFRGKLTIKDRSINIIGSNQLWIPPATSEILELNSTNMKLGNVEIQLIPSEIQGDSNTDNNLHEPFKAVLDLDSIHFPLILRTRQRGDRIIPYGMDGHTQKLSDFFINSGLPRNARETWPLVCDREGICWIPGFRVMHLYRVISETKRFLKIRINRI
jgi:tRNA(Ile)-lysidine synthase